MTSVVTPQTRHYVRDNHTRLVSEYDYTEVVETIQSTGAVRYDALQTLANRIGNLQHVRVKGVQPYTEDNYGLVNAQNVRNHWKNYFSVGNAQQIPVGSWVVEDIGGGIAGLVLADYIFAGFRADTRIFFATEDATANHEHLHFFAQECPNSHLVYDLNVGVYSYRVVTDRAVPLWTWDRAANAGAGGMSRLTYAQLNAFNASELFMYVLGRPFVQNSMNVDPYATIRADSLNRGAVFQSKKRISQHICAPVLNPNHRIGTMTPLNHDSRHLPPEMRDFQLRFDSVDWSRLGAAADKVTLNELTLFEFDGGNQRQAAETNILYLPQFQEFYRSVTTNEFSIDCFQFARLTLLLLHFCSV